MIRFILRFIGLICLAAGFILLIYDGTKSIAGNRLFLTSVRALWELINAGSLAKLEPTIQSYAGGLPVGPPDGDDPGGAKLGPVGRAWHYLASARPQEKAVDRLRAVLGFGPARGNG